MTDTEAKALALELDRIANQIYAGDPTPIIVKAVLYIHSTIGAATRHAAELREQAERFSEAVERVLTVTDRRQETHAWRTLSPFILPKTDPLVEAIAVALREASPFADDGHDYTAEAKVAAAAVRAQQKDTNA